MVDAIGGNLQPIGQLNPQRRQTNGQKSAGDAPTQTPVAKAVSKFVYQPQAADEAFSKLEYDRPSGENDFALGAYHDVKNFHNKEYLASLVGVDIYV